MIKLKRKKGDALLKVFFLFYLFTVLWFTVLQRSTNFQVAQFEVFWSYQKWLAGDWELGWEILCNMAMLMPYGFLLMAICRRRGKAVLIVLSAVCFSCAIETSQLLLMRGVFEWDDMISNGVGAMLGCLTYQGAEKLIAETKFRTVVLSMGVLFTIVCVSVYFGAFQRGNEVDNTSRAYCFQIDDAVVNGDDVTLTGFAFQYERKAASAKLVLQSTSTGKKINLDMRQTTRPDVNDYFLCEYDYEHTGFVATGTINPAEEYEVLIRWPWSMALSTGVFVKGENVRYAAEADFVPLRAAGTELEPIVNEGVLRVFEPEEDCWVYQLNGALYWIAGPGFSFEDDGTTYIQYQLHTTQTAYLPARRLEHNWLWDNIGDYFENNELAGDFGEYRVMRREIPTAYSVTSIVTGYYKNGDWIWRQYFRPYYELK